MGEGTGKTGRRGVENQTKRRELFVVSKNAYEAATQYMHAWLPNLRKGYRLLNHPKIITQKSIENKGKFRYAWKN